MTTPRILVTGATGFLGGAVLAHWLVGGVVGRFLALVRADTPAAAQDRLRRSMARFLGGEAAERGLGKCDLLLGDLTAPHILRDPRLDDVTHVLHLAANTSFRSQAGVYRVNVDGALRLAERMARSPTLKRYLHVGTASICGDSPPTVVYEDGYPRPDVRHIVSYTASKADAELRLARAVSGLPLVVARPSILAGHTRLGCGPSASIFWAFRAVDALGLATWDLRTRIDVVPVDWAAAALSELLFKERLAHDRYHLSAGELSSVSWNDIAEAFARVRESGGGRAVRRYGTVERAALALEKARFSSLFGPCDEDRVLEALALYYRFAELDTVFDNRRVLAEGVPPPPKFTDYLAQCLGPPHRSIADQFRDDE
ncbi:MAG: SDR family oxidoreductase [Planctomycetes bacterium]|nr:SDR family oxidoreductase [Planctomycetota bacterium]